MPGTTGLPYLLPYPLYTEPADVAAQIQDLAEAIDDAFENSNDRIADIQTRKGAGISAVGAQSIPTATPTTLTFTTEQFDNDTMANLGVNNTILTCVTDGFYFVTCRAAFEANATGVREIFIQRNAINAYEIRVDNAGAGTSTQISPAGVLWLQAGDTLRLVVAQNSGVNLNVAERHLQAIRVA